MILDYHGLSELLSHLLEHNPRHDVGGAACAGRRNDPDWLSHWPILSRDRIRSAYPHQRSSKPGLLATTHEPRHEGPLLSALRQSRSCLHQCLGDLLRPMGDGHRFGLQIVIMLRVGARSARTHDEGDAALGTRVLLMNFPGRHHVDVAGANRMPANQLELGRPDMRWAAVGAFIAIHRLPPLDQPIERPNIAMVMHVRDHVRLSDCGVEHKTIVRVLVKQKVGKGRCALNRGRPALRTLSQRRVCKQLPHCRGNRAPPLRLLEPLCIERTNFVDELPCRRKRRLFHGSSYMPPPQGQAGGCVPRGTDGRAQYDWVSVMTGAWRTAVSLPNPDAVSSRRSRTSSKPGSGQDMPLRRPSCRIQ